MAEADGIPGGTTPDPVWRTFPTYFVNDAAALCANLSPDLVRTINSPENVRQFGRRDVEKTFPMFYAWRQNMIAAFDEGTLFITIRDRPYEDRHPRTQFEPEPLPKKADWAASSVRQDDLMAWFEITGARPEYYFPKLAGLPGSLGFQALPGPREGSVVPCYLDPSHPRYAPKLAAILMAWLEAPKVPKKTVKQSLAIYLRAHAAKYGLTRKDGTPMDNAIAELAKVANWEPGGGPP